MHKKKHYFGKQLTNSKLWMDSKGRWLVPGSLVKFFELRLWCKVRNHALKVRMNATTGLIGLNNTNPKVYDELLNLRKRLIEGQRGTLSVEEMRMSLNEYNNLKATIRPQQGIE